MSSFEEWCKQNNKIELLSSWNYDKNGALTPLMVAAKSNKKVWWKCKLGHEWEAVLASRTEGRGCPYCNNRMLLTGYNDLLTKFPEVASEWNFEKNGDMSPAMFMPGSHKAVWWRCKLGHEWESTIHNRTSGHNCPYCSNQKVLIGYNDFKTVYPELLSEWDYGRNAMDPSEIVANSGKKVWWKCSHGHEWKAAISNRTGINKTGCPFCNNRKIAVGENDLEHNNQNLAKEWNYERNGELLPSMFSVSSSKNVWWRCEKGHEWKASIANRNKGRSCPICSGKKVLVGYNDLKTVAPGIAAEWNYEKNEHLKPEEVTFGSNKKVWWKCQKGHEWSAVISNRYMGTGCPVCSITGSSMPEQGVAFYLSKIYTVKQRTKLFGYEVDIYLPDYKIAIEYDGKYYHSTTESKEREEKKNRVLKDNGIKLFRIKESSYTDIDDFCIYYIPDKMQKNYIEMLYKLICVLRDLTGVEKTIDIDTIRDSISIREQYSLSSINNSLAESNRELAEEWDYSKNGSLVPSMFAANSGQKVWWKGKCGHSWQSTISNRNKGNGCPYCSGEKVLSGFNDLKSQYPLLAEEWDEDKNKGIGPQDVTCGGSREVWWICKKGHSWKASIYSRTKKTNGCPYCSGRRVLPGYNDLATLYPNLISEWNAELNSVSPNEITFGYGKPVWWKCNKGHEWKAMVSNRVRGTGCPYCCNQKIKKGYNDLESQYPDVAVEWNYDKNEMIKPDQISAGSQKKVWWKCKRCGYEWETMVYVRTKMNCGCPKCKFKKLNTLRQKQVICVETGVKYNSFKEAEEKTGINRNCISNCCKGKQKKAGGYQWRNAE